MRRIILTLVTARISVLSLSAAEVSFHVPSDTILTYCNESFAPDGDGVITLNLSEDNTATIQTGNGKEISVNPFPFLEIMQGKYQSWLKQDDFE